MSAEKRLQELKAAKESIKTKLNQAQGAIDTVMQQLQNEFNAGSIEEAEKILLSLNEEQSILIEQRNELIASAEEILSKYK